MQTRTEKDAEKSQQLSNEFQELRSREAVAMKEIESRDLQCQQLVQKLTTTEHVLEATQAESDVRKERYVYVFFLEKAAQYMSY